MPTPGIAWLFPGSVQRGGGTLYVPARRSCCTLHSVASHEVLADMNATLDEWVRFVFDHPVTETAWHFATDAPDLRLPPERAAHLIAETFERGAELLRPFTDAQLNQGFWFLVSSGNSDYICCLTDASVPMPARTRALRAFVPLFRNVMAARCAASLSHRSESGSALNSACYMWWDIIPLCPPLNAREPREPMHDEVVAVLAELLEIPHDACRESALHGLGHWAPYDPAAKTVIEAFLARSESLRPELLAYARAARTGCIQ